MIIQKNFFVDNASDSEKKINSGFKHVKHSNLNEVEYVS